MRVVDKSLFRNILPITYLESIFYHKKRRYVPANYQGMNILQLRAKKKCAVHITHESPGSEVSSPVSPLVDQGSGPQHETTVLGNRLRSGNWRRIWAGNAKLYARSNFRSSNSSSAPCPSRRPDYQHRRRVRHSQEEPPAREDRPHRRRRGLSHRADRIVLEARQAASLRLSRQRGRRR